MITEIKKIEFACLYISHRLAFIDYKDLRNSDCERSKKLRNPIERIGYSLNNRFVKYFLNKQSKLDLLWMDKIYQKNRSDIKHIYGKYLFHNINVTCCGSCHTGTSSTTKQEIQLQRIKYEGVFICKSCEQTALNIDNTDVDKYLFDGRGFYKDHGIANPGRSFLGFGGSKLIIKKKNSEIKLTNNLIHSTSLHECFHDKVKHKINCELYWIRSFDNKELSKYLDKNEIENISEQIERAGELGHRV